MRLAIALTILLIGFIACNGEDDQLLSYQNTVQVGLYSMHTHNDTTLTEIKIWGIGREDSLLYDIPSASSLYMNLNMNQDTTAFVFCTQTLQDEISFSYTRSIEPVSGAGGITMEMNLNQVKHTQVFIDSVAIKHRAIKYNENIENIQIFVY